MKEKIKLDAVKLSPYEADTYQDVYRAYYSKKWPQYHWPLQGLSAKTRAAIKGLYLEAKELLKSENKKDVKYATNTINLLETFVNAFGEIIWGNLLGLQYETLKPQQKIDFEKGSNLICKAFDKRFKKLYQTEKKQKEENQQKAAVEKLKKL